MSYMFNKCHKLKKIKGINKLNINKVIYMDKMFEECDELDYLILSKFKDSNTTINGKGLKNELDEEKKKNLQLERELNKKQKKIEELLNAEGKIIAVNFTSIDQTVNFPMACKTTDIFAELEKRLYIEYPDLKHKNIYFIANGNVINTSVTLEQNKIKNGNTIIINNN